MKNKTKVLWIVNMVMPELARYMEIGTGASGTWVFDIAKRLGESPNFDMATSVVAKSKFKEYKEAGKKLPEGWALDINGNPTTDPDEAMQGLVLPMAGFKGYGIAMLIDILSGLLSGAAFLNNVGRFYSPENKPMNIGFCCTCIDPYVVLGDKYDNLIG